MNPDCGPSCWRRMREWIWRLTHFWRYRSEMRHWFWAKRMRRMLRRERRAGKKALLVYVSVGGHIQFVDSLLRAVRARAPQIAVHLAVDETDAVPPGGFCGVPRWEIRPLREFDGVDGFSLFLTPEHNCEYVVEGIERICMFHGLPVKGKTFQAPYMKHFDGLFLQGPLQERMLDEFAEHEPGIANRLRRYRVGYPKTDLLFHPVRSSAEILREMGLDPRKKTVLYAPAFDRGTSLPQYGEDIFRKLAEMDCNVIVKLHPVSYDRRVVQIHSAGVYWPDVVERYVRPGHFVHAGNVDVGDCLLAADVMVTDVSSVALDFMLLDKPVVYIESPEFYAMIGRRGSGYETWVKNPAEDLRVNAGRTAGARVENLEDMRGQVERAFQMPQEHQDARRKVVKELLYHAGDASATAAEVLAEFLRTSPGAGVIRIGGKVRDEEGDGRAN